MYWAQYSDGKTLRPRNCKKTLCKLNNLRNFYSPFEQRLSDIVFCLTEPMWPRTFPKLDQPWTTGTPIQQVVPLELQKLCPRQPELTAAATLATQDCPLRDTVALPLAGTSEASQLVELLELHKPRLTYPVVSQEVVRTVRVHTTTLPLQLIKRAQ